MTRITAKTTEVVAELAAKKAEAELQVTIDTRRQHLKKLVSQRDVKIIQAKVKGV